MEARNPKIDQLQTNHIVLSGLRTKNVVLRKEDLERSSKGGSGKIKMLRQGRKTTTEN